MPCPLPPLNLNKKPPEIQRLSFILSLKDTPPISSGGVPTNNDVIQLWAEFDPIAGVGEWKYLYFPQSVDFDDYEDFERFCKRQLPKLERTDFDTLMNYLHNFCYINIDLRTEEVYPVIPRPTGYTRIVPVPPAPGTYLA